MRAGNAGRSSRAPVLAAAAKMSMGGLVEAQASMAVSMAGLRRWYPNEREMISTFQFGPGVVDGAHHGVHPSIADVSVIFEYPGHVQVYRRSQLEQDGSDVRAVTADVANGCVVDDPAAAVYDTGVALGNGGVIEIDTRVENGDTDPLVISTTPHFKDCLCPFCIRLKPFPGSAGVMALKIGLHLPIKETSFHFAFCLFFRLL